MTHREDAQKQARRSEQAFFAQLLEHLYRLDVHNTLLQTFTLKQQQLMQVQLYSFFDAPVKHDFQGHSTLQPSTFIYEKYDNCSAEWQPPV